MAAQGDRQKNQSQDRSQGTETPRPPAPAPTPPSAPKAPTLSIGRVVIYTAGSGYPRPAIVTDLEDGITSLTVFNPTGAHYIEDVEFSEEPKAKHWSWPKRV